MSTGPGFHAAKHARHETCESRRRDQTTRDSRDRQFPGASQDHPEDEQVSPVQE